MTRNVGGIDRMLRLVGGLVVIAAGVYFRAWWGAIGVLLLLTAAAGWCPLYLPFHFHTTGAKP